MKARKIVKICNIPIAFLVLFLVFYLVEELTNNKHLAYGLACLVAFIPAYLIDNMDKEKAKVWKKVIKIESYLKRKRRELKHEKGHG